MKCAEAKTWLSLVTATVNSLRAAIGFPFPPPPPPPAALEQDDVDRGAREVGGGPRVARVALVRQLAIELGDGRPSSGPSLRAIWVSGHAASSVRYASTTASLQGSPAANARRSAGAPASNVVWKSVAYSRATASRSAARAIASRNVTVGVPATSCSRVRPRPPGPARRIAAYASRASATVLSASAAARALRSDPPSGGTRRAARASGASSSTRPRLVLDGAQRAVASTAARIVAPSGRSPAAANAGPIATALARKSA